MGEKARPAKGLPWNQSDGRATSFAQDNRHSPHFRSIVYRGAD
jgi:hypothetical protein